MGNDLFEGFTGAHRGAGGHKEEEGLPQLRVKEPWYGYALGRWTEENEAEAELALQGDKGRQEKSLPARG